MAVPEGRAPWGRLAALAIAVLAVHAWLLGASPRLVQPAPRASPWLARTVEPAPAPEPPAAAPVTLIASVTAAVKPTNVQPLRPRVDTAVQAVVAAVPAALPAPAPAPAVAQETRYAVPPPARIRYKLTAQNRGITLNGEAELLWRHDGLQYEAQLQASAPLLATRIQRSTGAVTAEGLAPKRFSDKSRHEEATHFERDTGKVVFSSNRPEAALQPGAQDRLSVMLQLGALIAGAPQKYPPGTAISIQTASTRDAEPWVFTVDGMQTMQLPGGTVEGLKLTRQPRREYDVKVELWLAPGMAYAPVRLRLTQPNGDWVDQQWSSTDRG